MRICGGRGRSRGGNDDHSGSPFTSPNQPPHFRLARSLARPTASKPSERERESLASPCPSGFRPVQLVGVRQIIRFASGRSLREGREAGRQCGLRAGGRPLLSARSHLGAASERRGDLARSIRSGLERDPRARLAGCLAGRRAAWLASGRPDRVARLRRPQLARPDAGQPASQPGPALCSIRPHRAARGLPGPIRRRCPAPAPAPAPAPTASPSLAHASCQPAGGAAKQCQPLVGPGPLWAGRLAWLRARPLGGGPAALEPLRAGRASARSPCRPPDTWASPSSLPVAANDKQAGRSRGRRSPAELHVRPLWRAHDASRPGRAEPSRAEQS